MFDLYCRSCGITYLVDTDYVISLHSTSGGPVEFARCPHGHRNVVRFHERRPPRSNDVD